MEKLRLAAFHVKAFFQSCWYLVLRIFSAKAAQKYMKHMDDVSVEFGIKAIRNRWDLILCKKKSLFTQFPEFRRELVMSQLDDNYIMDMLRCIKPKDLYNIELTLIALNRSFRTVNQESLCWFKLALLSSVIDNKEEVIKYFYKNNGFGESGDAAAELVLKIFENDFEFIYWHAMNGGSKVIKQAFLKKLVSGSVSVESKIKLKKFVEEVGFKGCDIEALGISELLLNIRQYLTRREDIDIWEVYLLKSKNPQIIRPNVSRFGIESKEALQLMLELNDKNVIDSYNYYNANKKLRT